MQHELRADAFGLTLRPVRESDASFIVSLRSDPARARYIHSTSSDLRDQLLWMAAYFARPHDYYFMAERTRDARPEGTVGVYGIDERARSAEWGRWVMRPESVAAAGSALLIYTIAFERLRLDSVIARTVVENLGVLSFHDACGLQRTSVLVGAFKDGGRVLDMIEHTATALTWPTLRTFLEDRAAAAEVLLQR